jgi:acetyl-CoA carboxylase biotin carboxyl carrier protein
MAELKSPIPGKVVKTYVTVGQAITKDDEVFLMDFMKMETSVSGETGVVKEILVKDGDQVEENQTLLILE